MQVVVFSTDNLLALVATRSLGRGQQTLSKANSRLLHHTYTSKLTTRKPASVEIGNVDKRKHWIQTVQFKPYCPMHAEVPYTIRNAEGSQWCY